ncbi:hypothetical protein V1511DRAFT_495514 [Dipodascopsis uninucleata]
MQLEREKDHRDRSIEHHEFMRLEGERFICSLPPVEAETLDENNSAESKQISKADEERELAKILKNGWDLLEPLSGLCLYYIAEWWTYSYCHRQEVRQFHQLTQQQGKTLPTLQEDPNTESYILGKSVNYRVTEPPEAPYTSTEIGEELAVKISGKEKYLVQKLEGGSVCDLTGVSRVIEVRFHCNENSQDKIAWIKELSTCRYVMVIHTHRICQEPAFLPPKEDVAKDIICRQIMSDEQIKQVQMEAEVKAAMHDHDVEDEAADDESDVGLDLKVVNGQHPDDDNNKPSTIHGISNPSSESVKRPKSSPDLVTSANMLITDIQRKMAEGTFLTPEGKVATADDEFSYTVALVGVGGEVIGTVNVIVHHGKVKIELDQSNLYDYGPEDDKADLLRKVPPKLRDELREFSGGARLEDIVSDIHHEHASSSSAYEANTLELTEDSAEPSMSKKHADISEEKSYARGTTTEHPNQPSVKSENNENNKAENTQSKPAPVRVVVRDEL